MTTYSNDVRKRTNFLKIPSDRLYGQQKIRPQEACNAPDTETEVAT